MGEVRLRITKDYCLGEELLPQGSHFDVIILGAGPAGLLLASRLDNALRIAVLERGSLGKTTKFWLTNYERLARHDLQDCTRFTTHRATVGTFLGPPAVAIGNFAVADEAKLLEQLLQRCRSRGVALIEHAEALSFCSDLESIVVNTNRGIARTRLLVDASGGSSPIAATFRLHKLVGFYSIFGAHLEDLTFASTDVVGAYVIRFGDPPPLFEVIPTSTSSAFAVVFLASRRLLAPSTLRVAFNDHIRQNPFFYGARLEGTPKFGAIPIGRSVRRTIPGLLSCGEAAMIQAPLLGAAFNEVLDHMDHVASRVDAAFRETAKGIVTVPVQFPLTKRLNDFLQLLLARRLTDGSLEDFHSLVRFLDRLGPERAYDLFCTSLRGADLFTALRLGLTLARNSPFKEARSDAGPSWLTPLSG